MITNETSLFKTIPLSLARGFFGFAISGLDSLEEAKEAEIKNEMYQLKQAVVNKYTSYEKNDGDISLIGSLAKNNWSTSSECIEKIRPTLDFSDLDSDEQEKKLERISGDIARDYDEFVMIVNSGDMTRLGIDKVSGATYIVNYYTGSVYGPIDE